MKDFLRDILCVLTTAKKAPGRPQYEPLVLDDQLLEGRFAASAARESGRPAWLRRMWRHVLDEFNHVLNTYN